MVLSFDISRCFIFTGQCRVKHWSYPQKAQAIFTNILILRTVLFLELSLIFKNISLWPKTERKDRFHWARALQTLDVFKFCTILYIFHNIIMGLKMLYNNILIVAIQILNSKNKNVCVHSPCWTVSSTSTLKLNFTVPCPVWWGGC